MQSLRRQLRRGGVWPIRRASPEARCRPVRGEIFARLRGVHSVPKVRRTRAARDPVQGQVGRWFERGSNRLFIWAFVQASVLPHPPSCDDLDATSASGECVLLPAISVAVCAWQAGVDKGQTPRRRVGSLPCMFAVAQSLRDRLRRIPDSVCRPPAAARAYGAAQLSLMLQHLRAEIR